MAITTSSELQKQLTVIFGFQNQFKQKIGEIVGIGALSRQSTSNLINRVLNYLYAYNSMLIEYTGCQLYSMEFDLENYDTKKDIKLLPKSMLFIPGEYKEIHNLLLLLAPEMSLLDPQKSKNSVNSLGKRLYEISESLDRKELNEDQKFRILNQFAKRFAYLLQGEVIEGKWKKKLIGLKTKENEDSFLYINSQRVFNWQTKELILKNYQSRETELKDSGIDFKKKFEIFKLHPKIILEIIRNSFTLTANLLQIANTGSVSDTQHQILVIILNYAQQYMTKQTDRITIGEFKKKLDEFFPIVRDYFREFKEKCDAFIHTSQVCPLNEMLSNFVKQLPTFESDPFKSAFFETMGILVKDHIETHEYTYDFPEKVRSLEFKTPFLYIYQNSQLIMESLQKSLPVYHKHFSMETLLVSLIEEIQRALNTREESIIRILGIKSIHQLAQYFQVKIENYCNVSKCYEPAEILVDFKRLINIELKDFLDGLIFRIEDILEYCRDQVPSKQLFNATIDKLMLYRSRIETLWKLTLHQTTRKRIIENIHKNKLVSPEEVSQYVVELLQKKFGGIQSSWKRNFFQFFQEFIREYQNEYKESLKTKERWDSSKTIKLLFEFLELRIEKAISIEGFLDPLKSHLNELAMNAVEKHPLLKIYDYYLEGIGIIEQFPEYLHQIINRCIETVSLTFSSYPVEFYLKSLPSLEFITNRSANEPSDLTFSVSSYYDYLVNSELKYFSKLIAKPQQIILESMNKDIFTGKPLRYRIKFEDLGAKYLKTTITTNFKYVLPKF